MALSDYPAVAEPPPKPPPKPGTIDPGIDVGFGPGVAPPDVSPKTGAPVADLSTHPAVTEPQKSGVLSAHTAVAEPQKPGPLDSHPAVAEPVKTDVEGFPVSQTTPSQAQKHYKLAVDKDGNVVKIEAYDPLNPPPPPPQAPGGVPTEEELAYRTPHLAEPYDINKPTQAAGGVPTAQQLAMLPSQVGQPTIMPEPDVRQVTARATPNLSAQQLGESYGASAALVGGARPAFPTQVEQDAADALKVQQQQAEDDKKYAPPTAVTEQAIPTSVVPHKLTLNEQDQQEEFVKVDPQYDFKYSVADRVQALRNKFGNADELTTSYAKLPPEAQKELGPLYQQAIEDTLQWNIDHPQEAALHAGVRGVVDTAKTLGGVIQGVVSLPAILPQLVRAGVTSVQALDVAATLARGEQLTPEQHGILRTVLAAVQQGTHETAQPFTDAYNAYMQVLNEGTGQKGAPDQTNWEQIGDMRGDERKRYIQGKMDSLSQRYQTEALMAKGALTAPYRAFGKQVTGVDLPLLDDLAKKGVHIDPYAISSGATAVNFAEMAPMFALSEVLGVDGLISKAVGKGTEVSGNIMKGLGEFHEKYIEPRLPGIVRGAGELAGKKLTKTVVTAVTGGLGEFIPAYFYPGKWNPLVRFGGFVGEKLGEVPGLIREHWWDPTSRLLIDHGQELQNPVANSGRTLALHGPAGAMIRPVTAAAKGTVYALPFTAGPKTPEERGQIIGAGAGLLAAGAAPEAARDASMASLFFRDPAKYRSIGFPSMHYGTDYFGKNFDAQHDAFVNSQPKIDQDRINDSRGLMPGVEQYHLGNQDYQDAVTHLQNNGYLPDGNLRSRGFNILRDPNTGQALILINGDASGGFATAAHEIGHSIYRTLTPDQRDAFRNAAFQGNDPNALTQWYFQNLTGSNVNYMSLPDEAGIANGTQSYLPGLNGYTKEHFVEEMGAETVAALLRGQPLSHFIRDPSLMRRAQFALGSVMEKMGIRMTPEEATTVLGVRPGVAQMWIMDKALRDYFKQNPITARPIPSGAGPGGGKPGPVPPGGGGGRQGPIPKPRGRQTAAVPKPTGGPAPVPPPPPSGGPKVTEGPKVTNNQPEIGGGATGAPQSEIDDAVKGLQRLKFQKRQAQQMVANASGQNAAELLRNALRNHQLAKGMIQVPRAPQEAAEAQAPLLPHPLAAHRELQSPALLRRAIAGDPQATQALIERHGANWLQAVEKESPEVAAEFRRKYPEQAAEQDQRIKAGVEAKPEPVPKAADLPPSTPPHDAIAARAQEISQERGGAPGHEQEDWLQAERELRQRGIDAAKARVGFMPMAGERAQMYPEEEGGGRVFMSPVHGAKQFEIDDRDMTWVPAPTTDPRRLLGRALLGTENTMLDYNWGNSPDGASRLGDIINHPTLFQNYPDLRNVRVQMRPEMRGNGGYLAPVPGERETILLKTIDRGTLSHEIQHAVQVRENWPPGSNPDRVAREMEDDDAIRKDLSAYFNAYYPEAGPEDFKTQHDYFNYIADRSDQWSQWYRDRISRMASGAYLMSPGEVEARAVGKRAVQPPGWRMPPEEMLAQEQALTKARVQEDFRRMAEPPIGMQESYNPQIPGSKVSFMPDIPEARKGKKAKTPARVDAPRDLRDSLFTPEQRAWLADAQQKAIAGIDQYPETPISGARYADGDVKFPEKMTKAQVATFFDALNSNKLDFRNPEHQKLMADALTHDVLRRLISNPESLGWYNRVLDGAMDEMGKLEPRILQDPIHNLIMRLCMAITSQNQKVHPNFESAYRAYLHWDRTGKLPTDKAYFGGGTKAEAMIANFQKINDLIDTHDYHGTEEILKTPMTVRDIRDLYKVKIPGEAMGYTSEASMMLGPKIGSFFNNLSKLYHTLTADLWFTRTMNRLAGRMMGFKKGALIGVEEPEVEGVDEEEAPDEVETGKHQLGKLRNLIDTGQIENANKAKQRAMLKEINALEVYRDNPDDLDRDKAMDLSPTIREWAKAQHKIYQKSTGVNKKGEPLGTYGQKTESNLLSKNIDLNFQNLTDAPRNGTERENFRQIMKQVQSNLGDLGIDITHADNQAVLWYLEQDIFARAKGRKAGAFSADYLDAAYALRQKYQGKTPDEFGKVPEPEPPPSVPKIKRPKAVKAAAMPAGPDFPRAPPKILPTMRVSPLVSQADEDERKRQTGIPSAVTMPAQPEVRRGTMMMSRGQQQQPPPITRQEPSQPPPPQRPSDLISDPGIDIPATGRNFTRGTSGRPVLNIILHSTDGTRNGDIAELTSSPRHVSAHHYVMKGGSARVLVSDDDIAHHAGKTINPAHYSNAVTIGIEQEHKDGKEPWDDAQVRSTAKIVAHYLQKYPNLTLGNVLGHSDIAPERKQDPQDYPWQDFYKYVRGYMHGFDVGTGKHEAGGGGEGRVAGGVQRAAASDEARSRAKLQAAAHIMREEGSSGVQDGVPEIFGFRKGQDSEYEELARLRASGDEQGVQRLVGQGLAKRASDAGISQFSDPAVKAQIMSLAHMRGSGGARVILNAVGGDGHLTAESAPGVDGKAIDAINQMSRQEFMRRVELARTVYDQKFHGQEYWNRFGKGLVDRYAREREFYGSLN